MWITRRAFDEPHMICGQLARRFEVSPVDTEPVPLRIVFTITPARPIHLRLRPRT